MEARSVAVSTRPPDQRDCYAHTTNLVTLTGALRHLEPHDIDLLRLRFVADLSQQQIAVRPGISQMQVSRRLTRALANLRLRLTDRHPVGLKRINRSSLTNCVPIHFLCVASTV
jgi:DNA-directed RNA polymerase specialized sigma subunit